MKGTVLTFGLLAMVAAVGGAAQGPPREGTDNVTGNKWFKCRLFNIDQDANKLVVVTTPIVGSGSEGGDKGQEKGERSKTFSVPVDDNTKIHWQGSEKPVDLKTLATMNRNRMDIPMTIYMPNSATADEGKYNQAAAEIVLQRGRNNGDKDKDADNKGDLPR